MSLPFLPQPYNNAANPYGTDLQTLVQLDGSIDLDPGMSEASGRTLLVQRCVRRVTTPRGSVVDAPNDCLDLRSYIRSNVLVATPQQLQSATQREMLKEQGINSAQVGVQYAQATSTLNVAMALGSNYGPLNLTLILTATTIQVILNGLPVGF